ncbi:MAG: acyl-CoA dehydrogenase family protein [Pirellulaceae bacterium]|nr:acyl-CoA/acyl-ACP dehydrogenase [Planctomycetales bacterium]
MAHIYGLSEEETHVGRMARDLAIESVLPYAGQVDSEGRFPEEAFSALRANGLLGLHVPKEFGGLGHGPAVFAAIVEEIAKACGSTAMCYVMHIASTSSFMASQTLADRDSLLTAVGAGNHVSTLAFSERGSRSQFWAPLSQLTPQGDDFVTTAHKSWITSCDHADSIVSSAQMPNADSPADVTLYLIDRRTEGVTKTASFDGLGLRGNDSAPVDYQNVFVPSGRLLTTQGAGSGMMLNVILPWFCVGTAAMSHGLCLSAIDATTRHLTGQSFAHSGAALRDLPNLRARLAQMLVLTEQSRSLLRHTLVMLAQPDETTPLYVLQSRMAALQAAVDVTDLAMKTCGGAAFSKHLGIERQFRDARAGWVMSPTVDHLQEFIGRALVGLPPM